MMREPFCSRCAEHLNRERAAPACPTCAASVAPFEVFEGKCRRCRDGPARLRGAVRVGVYGLALGKLLRSYKYGAHEELEPILGRWLTLAIREASWIDRIEAIVSVPTHWRHRLVRPLHAAEALASYVAKRVALPHPRILRRTRAGRHQVGLSYTERAKNIRGASALRKGVELHDARLLLIDDVKTTGATIDECAKVLRRGGAAEVYAAVVVSAGGAFPEVTLGAGVETLLSEPRP